MATALLKRTPFLMLWPSAPRRAQSKGKDAQWRSMRPCARTDPVDMCGSVLRMCAFVWLWPHEAPVRRSLAMTGPSSGREYFVVGQMMACQPKTVLLIVRRCLMLRIELTAHYKENLSSHSCGLTLRVELRSMRREVFLESHILGHSHCK